MGLPDLVLKYSNDTSQVREMSITYFFYLDKFNCIPQDYNSLNILIKYTKERECIWEGRVFVLRFKFAVPLSLLLFTGALEQLRINFTRIFKVFPKLPSSLRDSGN